MHVKLIVAWMGFLALWSGLPAGADDFSGTKSLSCKTDEGVQYHRNNAPRPFQPESVGLPHNFIIEFKKMRITPARDSVIQRRSEIKRIEQVEEKLLLQGSEDGVEGVDDGVGWTMALIRKNGRFVITASGSDVGYIVFGSCRVSSP